MTDSNDTDADRVTRRRTLKGIGAGAVALSGVSSVAAAQEDGNGNDSTTPLEEWPQYGNNTRNTNHGPQEGVRENPTARWSFTVEDDGTHKFRPCPVVANGMVYAGNTNNTLYAFDEVTGELEWTSTNDGFGIYTTPAVDGDSIYFTDESGILFSLDAFTGEENWRTEQKDHPTSGPTVVDGTVFCALHDTMYALDADSGEILWSHSREGVYTQHPPVVNGGKLYYAIESGGGGGDRYEKFCLDAETGEEIWYRGPHSGRVQTPPMLMDDTVYWGGFQNVYSYDAETGEDAFEGDFLYKATNGRQQMRALAGTDGVVYGTSRGYWYYESVLWAIDAESGEEIWRRSSDEDELHNFFEGPSVSRGIVYATRWGFDAETGEVLWRFDEDDSRQTVPAIANATVYFGGKHTVTAIEEGE